MLREMTSNEGRNDDNNDGYMLTISVAKFVCNQVKGHVRVRIWGVKNVRRVRIRRQKIFLFRKIWRALFSCNSHFEIRPLTLLPTNY